MKLHWEDYLLFKNDTFYDFWKKHLAKKRDLLLVMGRGFDPRMCLCLDAITAVSSSGCRDVVLIQFDEGDDSPSARYKTEIRQNMSKLEEIIGDAGTIQTRKIPMKADDGYRIGSRKAAGIFQDLKEFEKYSDVVIDISSMPLDIYMPLIGKTLHLLKDNPHINLHVVVAEDISIDNAIKKSGLDDDASYMHGFTGSLDAVSGENEPLVWIPVLGEGGYEQMRRIGNLVSATEICPVLPSPSRNPRRGDDLMLEHREFLVEQSNIEIRDIIYAAEQNPFEAYRVIYKTIQDYRRSLHSLGECRIAISALSSKLISLGVFLVAYEEGVKNNKKVGIAYVASDGYDMNRNAISQWESSSTQLFSLWIAGECYER